ncbi:MAG: tetratricopeptide repeat protein [Chitinophagales bacterium]
MKQNNIDDLLDQYLAGQLTEEELKWRHEQLKNGNIEAISNKEIEEIVLPNELLYPLAFQHENIELKLKKNALPTENKSTSISQKETWLTRLKKHTWLPTLFAIGVLLLPIIYLFSWINADKQEIIQQHFAPYSISSIERDFDSSIAKNDWIVAKTKYEQGNYEAAIKSFRNVMLLQREDSYIDAFFIGVCQLSRRYALPYQASEYFEQENLKNTTLFLPAQWYLALAQLQCGEKEKAKATLFFLSQQQNGYKQVEANQLIEML